ncbi:MAG: polysaccharide deacetylase family protein [Clostridia bacterium]|nr:polysaccharide deacetylase family protein [Clostridia bacterium]
MRKILALLLMVLCLPPVVVQAETVVPVLMYHNLNETYAPENANIEMKPSEFEEQMVALLNAGYTPISLYQYARFEAGEETLPEKPVIITFDDGYLNNYTHAFPIVKKYNIPITIFVITQYMGMRDGVTYPHFTWEQAKEMQESGLVEIESHTCAHSDFMLADRETILKELRLSKYLIYKHIGKEAKFLAYPYGNYTPEVQKEARNAGYLGCVKVKAVTPGVNRKGDDIYALKRITASGGVSGAELIRCIEENKRW